MNCRFLKTKLTRSLLKTFIFGVNVVNKQNKKQTTTTSRFLIDPGKSRSAGQQVSPWTLNISVFVLVGYFRLDMK